MTQTYKKVLVSEATPIQLDWLVLKAQGFLRSDVIQMYAGGPYAEGLLPTGYCPASVSAFDIALSGVRYSSDWSQGGPIIEREGIPIRKHSSGTWYAHMKLGDGERAQWHKYEWVTSKAQKQVRFDGPTPLIAAMRCYVASKFGDKVEIPEELT